MQTETSTNERQYWSIQIIADDFQHGTWQQGNIDVRHPRRTADRAAIVAAADVDQDAMRARPGIQARPRPRVIGARR